MRERTNEVKIERDVEVSTSDGVTLLTDVYHPVGVDDAPTILERTPYGRQTVSALLAPEFAARGYRYVVQACRGTDGSGGAHSYFAEAGDGRRAADWIAEQGWFNGDLGTNGASYMGFTQWALASTRPPHLKAMVIPLSSSVRSMSWYPGGSFALEMVFAWDAGATEFNNPRDPDEPVDMSPEALQRRVESLKAGVNHLPLGDAIREHTGVDLELWREQLAHPRVDDPFWAAVDFSAFLDSWTVPTLLIDGWHDYPLPRLLEDFVQLRASDAPVRLRIGAGGHLGGGGEGSMTDATLDWFDTYLRGERGLLSPSPVCVDIQGEGGGWRELDGWPPPAEHVRWYLHEGGGMSTTPPPSPTPPDRYRYDPTDPTPSAGGIGMLSGGPADNRSLESRRDVLVYTSEPLSEPLVVIGPVGAELSVGSSIDHCDFFVRLCDVHPDGRSINVCDGLRRLGPESIRRSGDGSFAVSVPMWPAGHRFAPGHRLRVQVSSGAHPVYARNLGMGEPLSSGTATCTADQALYHEPGRLSSVTLPHTERLSP